MQPALNLKDLLYWLALWRHHAAGQIAGLLLSSSSSSSTFFLQGWRSLRSSVTATNTLTDTPVRLQVRLQDGVVTCRNGSLDRRRTDGRWQRETDVDYDADAAATNSPPVAAGVWVCPSRCHCSDGRSVFIALQEHSSVRWLQARCEWKQGNCLAHSQDVNTSSSHSPFLCFPGRGQWQEWI